MKITVITGTEREGCTYRLKEYFLSSLREGNEITQFYLPGDFPHFCHGCRACFTRSENGCPHSEHVAPIWNAIREADLLVIAFPVYASGIPGQLKALLDHFACRHMVHRPDKVMLSKRAVVLSQSLRSSNRAAQKEVQSSLTWLGMPDIRSVGFTLKDSCVWEELQPRRRLRIERTLRNLAKKYGCIKPARQNVKVRLLFAVSRRMIQSSVKKAGTPTADAEYWRVQGWL